jgi:hypothetical protein
VKILGPHLRGRFRPRARRFRFRCAFPGREPHDKLPERRRRTIGSIHAGNASGKT